MYYQNTVNGDIHMYLCSSILAGSRIIKMKTSNKSFGFFGVFPDFFYGGGGFPDLFEILSHEQYIYLIFYVYMVLTCKFLFQIYRQGLQYYHLHPHPGSRFIKMESSNKSFLTKTVLFFSYL